VNASSVLGLSVRWFRLLLGCYPPDFRDEFGDALVETYHDRARDAYARGALRLAGVWAVALADAVRNGVAERLRPAAAWRRHGEWGRDLELVGRRIRQHPLFVASTVATLTVGLATFAVVYIAIDRILIEPLPYPHSDDLYIVWRQTERFVITGPESAALQSSGGVIQGVGIFRTASFTLDAGAKTNAERMKGLSVSPALFDVLGVPPALGRVFRPEETGPASPNVVVLSDRLWRRLGADRSIVGAPVTISARPFTVIGVMPTTFQFSGADTDPMEAYFPLYDDLPVQPPLVGDWLALVRARHGTPASLVQQAVDRVSVAVDERVNQGKRRGLRAVNLQSDLVSDVRPALMALGVAAVALVLILGVNLASLLLARAVAREREFAVARALGAHGSKIVRATLLEGAVLGLLGGVAATIASTWGVRLLVALGPSDLPHRDTIALDASAAAVVVGVGIALGLAAAAVPALWASRVSLPTLLAAAAVRGGAGTGRMRRSLVVAQVALSLVLLSAGGLLVRSFQRLLTADPGFRPGGVLVFALGLSDAIFPKNADSYAFEDRVEQAVGALPGVRRVSATTTLPLAGGGSISWVYLPERVPGGIAGYRIFARAGYAEAIGMRVIDGRAFENTRHAGVHEALVDRQMARHFFGDRSPLGAAIMCDDRLLTIVGVVDAPRIESLHRDDIHPQIFMRAEDHPERPWRFAVHTDGDPRALKADVQAIVRRLDRRVPLSDVQTLDEIVAERRSRERTSAVVVAGLAVGALLLVAMGLFGMVTGSVARRRSELALRLALGATHRRVVRLVVGDAARLVVIGSIAAIPGVYLSGQALRGLLVDVSPFDGATLTAVAAGLGAVALLACYLAARPVTSIEPQRLLRDAG
jgi:putative ABC transport system permease protein